MWVLNYMVGNVGGEIEITSSVSPLMIELCVQFSGLFVSPVFKAVSSIQYSLLPSLFMIKILIMTLFFCKTVSIRSEFSAIYFLKVQVYHHVLSVQVTLKNILGVLIILTG